MKTSEEYINESKAELDAADEAIDPIDIARHLERAKIFSNFAIASAVDDVFTVLDRKMIDAR